MGREFSRAYGRLGEGPRRFLEGIGIRARWAAPPGLSSTCCVLGDQGSVLRAGARILGGAAQHASAQALLHHGAIFARVDTALAREVFGLARPQDAEWMIGYEECFPSLADGDGPRALGRAMEATYR